MKDLYYEVNFDGLPGLTHFHGGLSFGNIASIMHQNRVSNPKEAALQSLEKMKFLGDLGLVQGIFPPHERPYIPILKQLGYSGKDAEIIKNAYKQSPEIFLACCSASSMWAANAATATPSPDSLDRHLHLTPANLSYKFHRSFEHATTSKVLKKIFPKETYFTHHPALPESRQFSDEGAANHTRFCKNYGQSGVHLFVYGRDGFKRQDLAPARYPARQTLQASEAIARQHKILPERALFAQQNPAAIDCGVFHNDVASVGNNHLFLYHEKAFVETAALIDELKNKVSTLCDVEMCLIPVAEEKIPLEKAVETYLFNSQIININDNFMALIAPIECQRDKTVCTFIDALIDDPSNPLKEAHYIDIRESMNNGGGPACLRLRIVLSQYEIEATNPGVLLSKKLYTSLKGWIDKHYRDRLSWSDLADPQLFLEMQIALDELTSILNLGAIYSFQE